MAHERTSRRSFGYRSFITCDDPRGVVECGTVRKPKVIYTQKGAPGKRLESDTTTEEAQSPTSFHLLEVSRGAQKLNHVIKSWSSGHSKNNSKDMAQDLLKGALDLGESLAMLSRLQQSPNYLLESNKKQHRKKIERCSFDKDDDCLDMDEMQVMGSHQERRLSFEDMTTAIRHGVYRKNVFLDEDCNDINTFDPPSTSSSQSSSIVASSESFLLPAASLKKKNKKTKRSNLIAKLMGLEDASSVSSLPYDPRKGKGEKNLKQKKTTFDLDPPRERKHGHDPQKSGWKRKPTLDQTIEAVDYKGPPSAFNSEFSNSKQKLSDVDSNDRPPIVILTCLELEHPIEPKSRAQVYEEMFLGMRVRNNPLAQTDECESLNCNEDFGKAVKSKPRSQKKQIVEKKAQDGDKMTILKPKTTRGGSNMKVSNGTQRYRDDYAEARRNHEKEFVLQTSDSSRINEHASQTEITVADYVDDDQSSPSETSQVFGNPRNSETFMITNEYVGTDHAKLGQCSSVDSGPIQGANVCYKHELFGALAAPCIGKFKTLLLSNQPFIKHAEELFDLKVNPDSDLSIQTDNDIDQNNLSARELLDTANELIGLHGSRCSRACPLASTAHKPSCIVHYCYSSLEQLVDEVCVEMEAFRWYKKYEGDDHSTDSILMLVKRDLRTTGLVGGVWDMGWTTVGSADEIAEITRGVDQLVLDGLIQEILVDLSL